MIFENSEISIFSLNYFYKGDEKEFFELYFYNLKCFNFKISFMEKFAIKLFPCCYFEEHFDYFEKKIDFFLNLNFNVYRILKFRLGMIKKINYTA